MARQRLSDKKVKKYSSLLGKSYRAGCVRGGTSHRVDLFLADREEHESYSICELNKWLKTGVKKITYYTRRTNTNCVEIERLNAVQPETN